ncbi:MAG: NUDIX domain-containing protein [Bdellovibrionales bacterium]
MTDKKYQILSRETLFQGYFRMDRLKLRHEKFAGGWSNTFTREIFDRSGKIAAVLPFDPKSDKVVMIEQFRSGVLAAGEHPWITEVVAGVIDGGETPEDSVRREAFEEAGCTITDLHKIADYYTTPGCSSEHLTLFVGRTHAPPSGTIFGVDHEDEDIRVVVLDAAQAISLLFSNKIRDALSLIALQWFAMHHTELRSRWLVSDVGTPII